jgi:effector-binding domain-containing protein
VETACQLEQQRAIPTLAVRFRAPATALPQEFPRAYGRVMTAMQELGLAPAGPPYALYRNMDMSNVDVEAGFPVQHSVAGKGEVLGCELPAGRVATCMHVGSYESIEATYTRLMGWIREQHLVVAGPMYECYLNSPVDTPAEALETKVVIPVADAA